MQPLDTSGEHLLRHLRMLARESGVVIEAFELPRELDVEVGRLRLHCLEWGSAAATPVLFLHPGRLNAHSWDIVCLALSSRLRCIAIDLPGHGDSGWAPAQDYRLATCAQDLHGLVDALGLERFALVGASQGGLTALAYALQHPERLNGLVILDSGPEMNPEGIQQQGGAMAVFEPQDSFADFVRHATHSRTPRNPDKLRFTLSQNVRQREDGKWVWKFDAEYRSKMKLSEGYEDLQRMMPAAGAVRCPVLILRGEHSPILQQDQAARLAAAFENGQWASVPGTRHMLHHENPLAIVSLLRDFTAA